MTPGASPPSRCPRCGHAPAVGRFCSECGRLLRTSPTDTAERPRVEDPPTVLPETSPWGVAGGSSHPPAARWPLYADERAGQYAGQYAGSPVRDQEDEDDEDETVLPVVPVAPPEASTRDRRGGAVLPWVAGAAVVLALAAAGAVLLLGGRGDDPAPASAAPTTADDPSARPSAEPSETPRPSPTPSTPPAAPVDVSREATASASATAPPSTDVAGDPVRYDAANVVDGDPSTAWRVAGDGQGATLTLTLAAPTSITRLGVVNGYAKSEPGYDGYAANRRLTSVDWVLDDGTVVPQGLGETTRTQTVDVAGVETSTVTLRVRGTTAPGSPGGRDFTAVSEIEVQGTPR